jgi:hypothetical protein
MIWSQEMSRPLPLFDQRGDFLLVIKSSPELNTASSTATSAAVR